MGNEFCVDEITHCPICGGKLDGTAGWNSSVMVGNVFVCRFKRGVNTSDLEVEHGFTDVAVEHNRRNCIDRNDHVADSLDIDSYVTERESAGERSVGQRVIINDREHIMERKRVDRQLSCKWWLTLPRSVGFGD